MDQETPIPQALLCSASPPERCQPTAFTGFLSSHSLLFQHQAALCETREASIALENSESRDAIVLQPKLGLSIDTQMRRCICLQPMKYSFDAAFRKYVTMLFLSFLFCSLYKHATSGNDSSPQAPHLPSRLLCNHGQFISVVPLLKHFYQNWRSNSTEPWWPQS